MIVAAWLIGLGFPVEAQHDARASDIPLAVVGDIAITERDVSAILESRQRAFRGLGEQARRRAIKTLVAEVALATQMDQRRTEHSPLVAASLDDARRQILFQAYAQSRYQPREPTVEEVDAYIAANSHQFDERKEYRFIRLVIEPRHDTDRRAATELLQGLDGLIAVTERAIDRVLVQLSSQKTPFVRQFLWSGSEALDAATRERLGELTEDSNRFGFSDSGGVIDAIRLFDVRSAPVEADIIRTRIIGRMQLDAFQTFQSELIRELAEPYLEAGQTSPVPSPALPTQGEETTPSDPIILDREVAFLAVIGLLGFLTAFALHSSAQWVRASARLRRDENVDGSGFADKAVIDKPFASAAIITATMGVIAMGVFFSIRTINSDIELFRVGILAGGGALLGLFAGAIYGWSRPVDYTRPSGYGLPALWCAALVAAISTAVHWLA